MTDGGRESMRGLAERLLAGEPVLGELFAEALRRLDDEIDRVAPDERAFLEEVRFSCPAAEEGPPGARARARGRIVAAAEAFTGRVRAISPRTTIRGTSRHRRTTR
ncbi:MAG: hypothetical protein H6Q01_1055 [Acidobacteria bacterium]|nr:hypothetical protein [Acidobacteriota bacterium]